MVSLPVAAASSPRTSAARRVRAALLAALAIASGAVCRDQDATGPGVPVRASLAVAPVYQASAAGGGPVIRLARVRARLTTFPGGPDTTTQVVDFTGDSAVVTFDVTLAGGTSTVYQVLVDGIDAAGDTLFRGADSVRAFPNVEVRPSALTLRYDGPDAGVRRIGLAPRDTILDAPDSLRLRVFAADESSPSRLLVGWTSRDADALAVSAAGTVRPRSIERDIWVVAQLYNGVKDSALVHVRAPVASLALVRRTASVVRGDTVRLVAEARDSIGTAIARVVTWTALDTTVLVDSTGLVLGHTARATGRVVASIGTRADTATISVLPVPVGSVVASPDSVSVAVGGTTPLTASVLDARSLPNPDWTVAWTTSSAAVATIDAAGLVTAQAIGRAVMRASADGQSDSVIVNVVPSGPVITSTVISPRLDSLTSLGDTLRHAVQSYAGTVPAAGTHTWISRNPAVFTVAATGTVTAVANGSAYLVVSEQGGTRDSALVVVRQKVSTVAVTPNSVTRYLGRTQQFAASAVDARGNPVSFAVFAWSSTAASIVNVDSTGLATMAGIGSAIVRATAGGITGQADVTVLSPITRIVVSPDSVVLDAFGLSRGYTATAYDTLNAVMSGVTFAWASSNPSVASLSVASGAGTTATAVANGTTRVRATAQGVTGEALLTVRQTLASVEVTPASVTVAPQGRVVMTARGRDPGGSYLTSSPAFTWASGDVAIFTVDASGVVTGVQAGSSAAVIATGPNGVQGTATVFVSNSVPQSLSFGRDTLKLGRSTSNSIPLYLSAVPTAPLTVSLTVLDTIAYFPTATATFPAGTTAINVTLATRNAGTTRAIVSDVSDPTLVDTVVVNVQANVRFSTTSVSMVATDQRPVQVILSDPAPANGVYVAFTHGTAGIADVSPDPVFIQQGLLASNVVVKGLAAGTSVISLSAAGVTGANTLTANVSAAALTWYYGPTRLGAGQYDPNVNYLYVPQTLTYPITVTLASSDSTVARMQPQVVIPAGQGGTYVDARAFENRTGTVTITASAPGWTSAVTSITSQPPKLGICCNISFNTTSAPAQVRVYPQDSLGGTHRRINSLNVTLVSRDTLVAVVDSATVIGADQNQSPGLNVTPRGGGSTWIVAMAGGHRSDSLQVSVAAPNLSIYYGETRLGAGQYEPNANYVYIPNPIATPVTVTFTSSDSSIAKPLGPMIIPAGQTGGYYRIEGYRPGTVTYTASAAGYNPASQSVLVTTPRLTSCCNGSYPTFAPPVAVTAYAADSLGSGHPLLAPLSVSLSVPAGDTGTVAVDSSVVTIAAGATYNGLARVSFRNPGTGRIALSAPGYRPDTLRYTVDSASIALYYGTPLVAAGQIAPSGNYVYIPNPRGDTVKIAVTNRSPGVALFPDTIRLAPSSNGTYFDWEGVAPGRDSVTFTSPGYRSLTAVFPVSRRLLRGNDMPSSLASTAPPFQLRAFTIDTANGSRPVRDTVTVRMFSTDTTVLKLDSAYVHILRGQYNSTINTARIVGVTGATPVRVVYQDSAGRMAPDTTNDMTVVGPVLRFYYGSPSRVGMRQVARSANYVYTDNSVASPVTVTLTSSNTTVLRSSTITIPAGSNGAYFDITGGDTLGLVRLTATATGYQLANLDVEVGQPQLILSTSQSPTTTSPAGQISLYLADQVGSEHETTDTFTVTLLSTQPGVAAPDSTVVHFTPGTSRVSTPRMRYLGTGTTLLIASDGRSAVYRYVPDTVAVTVSTPPVQVYYGPTALGTGQRTDNYVYVPNAPTTDTLRIAVRHNAALTTVPDTIKLAPGTSGAYYTAVGLGVTGTDTLVFSAPGHLPGSTFLYSGPGRLALYGWPGTLARGDSVQVRVGILDPADGGKSLAAARTFTLTPNAFVRFRDGNGNTITQVTVDANNSQSGAIWAQAVASGTASVTVSGTGYTSAQFNTAVP